MKEKKALLVRLSSLGDVIFTIPLANVLKSNGYKVTWIVSEKGIDVVKNNPAVDDAILAPFAKWKKQSFFKNFNEYLEIIKYIRAQKFDIAIDSQGLLKSFIWMILSGAKRRIVSLSGREFSYLGGNEFIAPLRQNFNQHAIYNYLKFAQHLDMNIDNLKVTLPPSENDSIDKIDSLISDIDKTKPLMVICPRTTWKPKHWDKNNWKELIQRLEKDYTIIFTGTDKDINYINEISNNKHLNLAGKTNVKELVELYKRCDIVVSLDSGSTHLAWATQVPKIVSIFCCTPVGLYAPIGDKEKYIALSGNLNCQPCHKKICPLKTNRNKCTQKPSVDEVFDAIEKLIPVNKVGK